MENESIIINGEKYIKASSVQKPSGNRAVVVVDRGWIFAGDVEESENGIYLSNAVWVFRWERIGFNGVIESPEKADIRPMRNGVQIPAGSEIFRVPVAEGWGIK